MASLSNINGLFDVHSTGAILFSTSHGTSGQILRSNGNAAPTWVAASTVIGGPYLPLTGGTLIGPLAGTSATFSGNVTASAFLMSNGSLTNSGFWGATLNAGTGSYADFALLDSGTTRIMHVPTGTRNVVFESNVAIGTISPAAKLSVVGSGENGGIFFGNSGAQEHRFYSSANSQFNTIGSSVPIWNWAQYTGVGVAPNYKMTLNNTGLGIGTPTPTARITLADHTTAAGGIKFRTASSAVSLYSKSSGNLNSVGSFNSGSRFRVLGGNGVGDPDYGFRYEDGYGMGFSRAGADIIFVTNSTEQMRLDSSGNVLVSSGGLTVGATSQVAGTQVAIVGGGSTNLQRWGSTSDGGNQASYRFRIDQGFKFIANNGSGDNLVIDSGNGSIIPSGGIYLGGTAAVHKLDYYEEGTFIPYLEFGGNRVGIVYGSTAGSTYQGGNYTRIGRVVTFSLRIILSSKGTSVGAATIVGLPYTVGGQPANYGSAMYSFANNFLIPERPTITIDTSSSVIRLRYVNSPSGAYGNVTNSDFNNNSDIILTGTYQTS